MGARGWLARFTNDGCWDRRGFGGKHLSSSRSTRMCMSHQRTTSHSCLACDEDGHVRRHLSRYHLTVDAGVCGHPPPLVRVLHSMRTYQHHDHHSRSMSMPATITFCSHVVFNDTNHGQLSFACRIRRGCPSHIELCTKPCH